MSGLFWKRSFSVETSYRRARAGPYSHRRINSMTGRIMQRHALAPLGVTREQILVAIPHRATDWSIAQRNRGQHRLLLPIDASLRALSAVRYITEELVYHVAGVHVVNVQSPLMSGDITPLVSVKTITALREA